VIELDAIDDAIRADLRLLEAETEDAKVQLQATRASTPEERRRRRAALVADTAKTRTELVRGIRQLVDLRLLLSPTGTERLRVVAGGKA
jgi:hypothetical protein